jgi:hypothetical protein
MHVLSGNNQTGMILAVLITQAQADKSSGRKNIQNHQ